MDEKIGEIIIVENSEPLKAKNKFVAYIRLFQEVDVELEEICGYALDHEDLDVVEVEKAKGPFPPDEEILWKAISEVIPNEPIPEIKYIALIRSLKYSYDVEDIQHDLAEAFEKRGLLPESKSMSCVTVRKVRLFPFERPKRKTIPITRRMFKKMLQGLREKRVEGEKNVLPIRRKAMTEKDARYYKCESCGKEFTVGSGGEFYEICEE